MHRHHRRCLTAGPTVLALLLAAAVAGCGGLGTATSTPAPATGAPGPSQQPGAMTPEMADLDGRTFTGLSVTGADLAAVTRITVGFAGVALTASGGCNQLSAPYGFSGDRLMAGTFTTTDKACDPPLGEQDTWLATFLDGAMVQLDGSRLSLEHDGAVLVLED